MHHVRTLHILVARAESNAKNLTLAIKFIIPIALSAEQLCNLNDYSFLSVASSIPAITILRSHSGIDRSSSPIPSKSQEGHPQKTQGVLSLYTRGPRSRQEYPRTVHTTTHRQEDATELILQIMSLRVRCQVFWWLPWTSPRNSRDQLLFPLNMAKRLRTTRSTVQSPCFNMKYKEGTL